MRDMMADAAQDLRVAVADARDEFHADMVRASKRYAQARERADNRYARACMQWESDERARDAWLTKIRLMSDDTLAQVHAQIAYVLVPARAIRITEAERDMYARRLVMLEDEMTRPHRTQEVS